MAGTQDQPEWGDTTRERDVRRRRRLARLEEAFDLIFETTQRTLLVGAVQFVGAAIGSDLFLVTGEILMYVLWGWLLYAMHRRYAPRLLPLHAPWRQHLRHAAMAAVFFAAYGAILLMTAFGLGEIQRAAEAGYFL